MSKKIKIELSKQELIWITSSLLYVIRDNFFDKEPKKVSNMMDDDFKALFDRLYDMKELSYIENIPGLDYGRFEEKDISRQLKEIFNSEEEDDEW